MRKFVKTMIAFLLLLSTFSLTACDFIRITSYKHENESGQAVAPSDSFTPTSQSKDGQSDTDTDEGGEQGEIYYIPYVETQSEANYWYDSLYFFSMTEEERLGKLNSLTIQNKAHVTANVDPEKVPYVLIEPEKCSDALRTSFVSYKTDNLDEALAVIDLLYKNSKFFSAPCLYPFIDLKDLPFVSHEITVVVGNPFYNEKREIIPYSSDAEIGNHVFDRSDINYLPQMYQVLDGYIQTNTGRIVKFHLIIDCHIPGYVTEAKDSQQYQPNMIIPYMTYADKFLTDSKLGFACQKGNPDSLIKNTRIYANYYYFNTAEGNPYFGQRFRNKGEMVDTGFDYLDISFYFYDQNDLFTQSELDGLTTQLYDILKTRTFVYDYYGFKALYEFKNIVMTY